MANEHALTKAGTAKKPENYRNMPKKPAEKPKNQYYSRVSGRYKIVKYVLIVLLVIYAVAMYAGYHSDITYSSLMFLFRDVSTEQGDYTETLSPVSFDEQENMAFSVFKSDVAVIGNSGLFVYSPNGDTDQSFELGYDDPGVCASEKYLVAYNIGEVGYSVFNTITRVGYEDADGSVESADVNDRGEYLLVCRSDETKYEICTYDSSLRVNARYFKNKYVTSAAIGRNDSRVLIASFDPSDGGITLDIEFFKAGASEAESSYSAAGVFPVKCGFFDDNSYYVICTDRVLFFNKNGAFIREEISQTYEITSYAAADNRLALAGVRDAIGRSSGITLFDSDGNAVYNTEVSGRVTSLALTGEAIYALSDGTVSAVYPKTPDKPADGMTVPSDSVCVLPYGNGAVLCRRGGIESVTFKAEDTAATE